MPNGGSAEEAYQAAMLAVYPSNGRQPQNPFKKRRLPTKTDIGDGNEFNFSPFTVVDGDTYYFASPHSGPSDTERGCFLYKIEDSSRLNIRDDILSGVAQGGLRVKGGKFRYIDDPGNERAVNEPDQIAFISEVANQIIQERGALELQGSVLAQSVKQEKRLRRKQCTSKFAGFVGNLLIFTTSVALVAGVCMGAESRIDDNREFDKQDLDLPEAGAVGFGEDFVEAAVLTDAQMKQIASAPTLKRIWSGDKKTTTLDLKDLENISDSVEPISPLGKNNIGTVRSIQTDDTDSCVSVVAFQPRSELAVDRIVGARFAVSPGAVPREARISQSEVSQYDSDDAEASTPEFRYRPEEDEVKTGKRAKVIRLDMCPTDAPIPDPNNSNDDIFFQLVTRG